MTEQTYWCARLLLGFLAQSPDTAGQFTLIDGWVRQGTEPPPHRHTHEDEALLVLEGELEVWVGSQSQHLGPGQYLLMPKGVVHYFRCVSPQVHLLVRLSPGGLEQGFKAFGVPLQASLLPPPQGPSFAEIAQIFAGFGVYFVPLPQ